MYIAIPPAPAKYTAACTLDIMVPFPASYLTALCDRHPPSREVAVHCACELCSCRVPLRGGLEGDVGRCVMNHLQREGGAHNVSTNMSTCLWVTCDALWQPVTVTK